MADGWLFPPDPHPYAGLLFIGDPHVVASPPCGFRLDVITPRPSWEAGRGPDMAQKEFLPILLGDLFHLPLEQPQRVCWWPSIQLFRNSRPFGVVGNHDKHEAEAHPGCRRGFIEAARAIRLIHRGRAGVFAGGSWQPGFPGASLDRHALAKAGGPGATTTR